MLTFLTTMVLPVDHQLQLPILKAAASLTPEQESSSYCLHHHQCRHHHHHHHHHHHQCRHGRYIRLPINQYGKSLLIFTAKLKPDYIDQYFMKNMPLLKRFSLSILLKHFHFLFTENLVNHQVKFWW